MKQKSQKKKTRGGLITNETAAPALVKNQFQSLTWNLTTKLVRKAEMEGEEYTVVDMVMMTEGVHSGSRGPMFYSADELGKTPEVWNHKPIVVYHPKKKGTACEPQTLSECKIGIVMNARFDAKKKRLVAEAWLKEDRVKKVDNRVWDAVLNKEMMELSTGIFADYEETEGTWNGEEYKVAACNIRPDHLAILPDEKGACSVADGAGFIRNTLHEAYPNLDIADVEFLRTHIMSTLKDKSHKAVNWLLTNEASHEKVRDMLYAALAAKYPPEKGYGCPWIEAVYDGAFIYCMGSKTFKLGYSATDTSAKLTGEPVEVVRVTEYRTAPATNAGTSQPTKKTEDKTMDKDQIVADLIANHGYTEEDRGMLMGLDVKALARIQGTSTVTANKAKTVAAPAAAPVSNTKTDTKTETAPATAPATVETVLNADQRAALAYGQRKLSEDKAKLIGTITANKANKFSAEVLNSKSIEELEGIAALAAVSAPAAAPASQDYSGLGHAQPIANKAATEEGAALELPTFDFSK